jgi:hypothetical protein
MLTCMLQNKIKKVIFVDQLNILSLLHIFINYQRIKTIFIFEPIGNLTHKFLQFFKRWFCRDIQIRQISNHIGQVRNSRGELQFFDFYKDAFDLSKRVNFENLEKNVIIQSLNSIWPKEKLCFYISKKAETVFRRECIRLGLMDWIVLKKLKMYRSEFVALIREDKWFPYLKEYADTKSIELESYGKIYYKILKASEVLKNILKFITHDIGSLYYLKRGMHSFKKDHNGLYFLEKNSIKSTPKIGNRYWYRTLSLDPKDRSEFFWVKDSGIKLSDIVLYDYKSDNPLDRNLMDLLKKEGVVIFGNAPGIKRWNSTGELDRIKYCVKLFIVKKIIKNIFKMDIETVDILSEMWKVADRYSYWLDFYKANNIVIDIGTMNLDVSQVLALDSLKGVSIAYQYSSSNIISPTNLLSSAENIQFIFSKEYELLYRQTNTPIDRYIHTGYIYDYACIQNNKNDESVSIKNKLSKKGVQYIICFFDENSMDRWDSFASNDAAAKDYEFLIQWLLNDPTLGLIFKPKKSIHLLKRISSISGLIEKGIKTDRCIFLNSDNIYGNIFPAQAARAADLCIGKLLGNTACLEAQLCKKRTIFIDVENIANHPFYNWNYKNLIFKKWEDLRNMVEMFRINPSLYPEFGSWRNHIKILDPFTDGNARKRMNSFIDVVFKNLSKNISKRDAIKIAAEDYGKMWGAKNISYGRDP